MRRAVLLCVLLLGCDVGPNGLSVGLPVAVVEITPAVASLREGDSVRLVAVPLDADGHRVTPRKTPTWFTPDVTHISVDTTGLVRGLLAGPAEVQVTADSVTGIARITVLSLPAANVSITIPTAAVEVGDTVRLLAIVRDATGKRLLGSIIHWASSDSARARVDSSGLLDALATGAVTVTASVDSVSGSAGLTIFIPVASVQVTPDTLTLQYDDTARLTVTLRDSTGVTIPAHPFTWSLGGDSGAVKISYDLLVSAADAGSATVSVFAGHATGQAVVDVPPLRLTGVSLGAKHSCGLDADGTAYCWGDGTTGALGSDTTASESRPRRVAGGLRFSEISAGDGLTCALTTTGAAYCWGRNETGQTGVSGGTPCTLDYGTGVCIHTPTPVPGGLQFQRIVAGAISSCGLTASGAAYCWGAGGVLGDSTMQSSTTPVAVVGGHAFRMLARPGDNGTCGLDTGGTVYCWGVSPVLLQGAAGLDTLTGASDTYCGLAANSLVCWGWIPYSLNGASGRSPFNLLPGKQFSHVAATTDHICGVTLTGEAICWGRNPSGELGDGTLISRFDSVGTAVAGGYRFASVAVGGWFFGESHSCGLATDGRLLCWGANNLGQLGAPVGARAPFPMRPLGQP